MLAWGCGGNPPPGAISSSFQMTRSPQPASPSNAKWCLARSQSRWAPDKDANGRCSIMLGAPTWTAGACASVPEGRAEVHQHAQLGEHDRHRDVAVERRDLAVLDVEDVTARRVDLDARRGDGPGRHHQIALVGSVQRELDDHDVAVEVELVELA